jgi:CRP-like cAMP-binding protein
MALRAKAVGLEESGSFEFPVTQGELGDALGLSNVHVNRVIMGLRKDRLITMRNSTVTVLDWEGLKRAGDFDPLYLHQDRRLAA